MVHVPGSAEAHSIGYVLTVLVRLSRHVVHIPSPGPRKIPVLAILIHGQPTMWRLSAIVFVVGKMRCL